jgi:hypothetical protein
LLLSNYFENCKTYGKITLNIKFVSVFSTIIDLSNFRSDKFLAISASDAGRNGFNLSVFVPFQSQLELVHKLQLNTPVSSFKAIQPSQKKSQ